MNVGAAIDINCLFSIDAFWRGLVLFAFPAFLGKAAVGFFDYDQMFMLAFAMMGRGEFAFLCLNQAKVLPRMDCNIVSACIWALVLAIVISPLVLGEIIKKRECSRTGWNILKISIDTRPHEDLALEINEFMHEIEFDILGVHYETNTESATMVYEVHAEHCVGEADIDGLKEQLRDILDCETCKVEIAPLDTNDLEVSTSSQEDDHSFMLNWTIPKGSATAWSVLMNVESELSKHNLKIGCLCVSSMVSSERWTKLECVIQIDRTDPTSYDLNEDEDYLKHDSLGDIEMIEEHDPVSKMGMHVLKATLHQYNISGETKFNNETMKAKVNKLM